MKNRFHPEYPLYPLYRPLAIVGFCSFFLNIGVAFISFLGTLVLTLIGDCSWLEVSWALAFLAVNIVNILSILSEKIARTLRAQIVATFARVSWVIISVYVILRLSFGTGISHTSGFWFLWFVSALLLVGNLVNADAGLKFFKKEKREAYADSLKRFKFSLKTKPPQEPLS